MPEFSIINAKYNIMKLTEEKFNRIASLINPQGDLEPLFAWSLSGALIYSISPVLVMNVMGAWLHLEESEYNADNSYKSGTTCHINLIYSPVKSVNVGIEYQIAQRVNKSGNSGIANRI